MGGEPTFSLGGRDFDLVRPHTPARSPLRAWSAADELALADLAERAPLSTVLVVNDRCGALTVGAAALGAGRVVTWTDSELARAAIADNVARHVPALDLEQIPGDRTPTAAHSFANVIVAVPKSNLLLDHQLVGLAPLVESGATVVGAAMSRHVHSSTLTAFEKAIGPVTTTRAVRKARLIHAVADGRRAEPPAASGYRSPHGIDVAAAPGVFSAGRLDTGTELLLNVLLGRPSHVGNLVDLGAGAGVMGTTLAVAWPGAEVVMTDVSDLAAEAAARTAELNGVADRVTVRVGDGLDALADRSVELIVTNPPFHQGHAVDADLTNRLLGDASRVVTADGEVVIVAQRHLKLHTRLRRWFGRVEAVSGHPTHVVISAGDPR